jgi:hypothetical protein
MKVSNQDALTSYLDEQGIVDAGCLQHCDTDNIDCITACLKKIPRERFLQLMRQCQGW